MTDECHICVIGSGAGGGPVALRLAEAGRSVIVLEKGPHLGEKDFAKDEIADQRRHLFTPSLRDEPQVVETWDDDAGGWDATPTAETGWDFWNGSLVGGATNLMSGFFHRMKPDDFRLRSAFGPIEGATIADWPITYDDLEPYYDIVEREVGVSGQVVNHPFADRRSHEDFPFPPTLEHPFSAHFDAACRAMGLHPFPVPRAVLSEPAAGREACAYAGYCGGYGCATGAKGSSRAALLGRAVATGRCEVRPRAMVRCIESDEKGRAVAAEYVDEHGAVRRVRARVFVVACQAIETARLLLLSTGPRHPHGLGNRSGIVGQNLIFSAAAAAYGDFPYAKADPAFAEALRSPLPFINRAVQDFYELRDPATGARRKGGTLDFMWIAPSPIAAAISETDEGAVWGWPLKERLLRYFRGGRHMKCEAFLDWLPSPDSRVTLDPEVKDRFGLPVARVRIARHPRNREVARALADEAEKILRRLGAEGIETSARGAPSTNLVGGTCRFGDDPRTSVLDRDCRAHDVENLYVTDGSFMPTGGSVPFTWTIYANAFRVAARIAETLGPS